MSRSTRWTTVLFLLPTLLLPSEGISQANSPAGAVPPELLRARRARLLEALGGSPAIITSAQERSEGEHPQDSFYRESNNFLYLTGMEAPGGWLVVNGGGVGEIVLYLPPRTPRTDRWTGRPRLGPEPEARPLTGIEEVRPKGSLESDLIRWFSPAYEKTEGNRGTLYLALGDLRHRSVLDSVLMGADLGLEDGSSVMSKLRLVKDSDEIRRLKRAAEITMEAHREVWRVARPGLAEYELEAALEYVFHAQGAERVGFPSVVGSGPNGMVLHYDENRRVLEEGELVVVDIGAEFGYYSADITRTFPTNGTFSPRQKALYDLVLGARNTALGMVRPGVTLPELDLAARMYFRENSGDLCGEESCLRFFAHRLSHWLGMDVHDGGDSSVPLVSGMVLTIAPGIYLLEEGMSVRIEDDVLVTAGGYEVLTEDLPRTTEEIEAAMEESPRWVRPAGG